MVDLRNNAIFLSMRTAEEKAADERWQAHLDGDCGEKCEFCEDPELEGICKFVDKELSKEK